MDGKKINNDGELYEMCFESVERKVQREEREKEVIPKGQNFKSEEIGVLKINSRNAHELRDLVKDIIKGLIISCKLNVQSDT